MMEVKWWVLVSTKIGTVYRPIKQYQSSKLTNFLLCNLYLLLYSLGFLYYIPEAATKKLFLKIEAYLNGTIFAD